MNVHLSVFFKIFINICLIKGDFSFVLYPAIPQVTILHIASQLSCRGLLCSTSCLPLAQAISLSKFIYETWLCRNQLQIMLSTYTQKARERRVAGSSPEVDTAHGKASGAPFCCWKTVSVHWLGWPESPLLMSANLTISRGTLYQTSGKSRTQQKIYKGQGFWKLLLSSMTRVPNNTDLPLIPRSGKNPIATLYNPRLCLSNLGT